MSHLAVSHNIAYRGIFRYVFRTICDQRQNVNLMCSAKIARQLIDDQKKKNLSIESSEINFLLFLGRQRFRVKIFWFFDRKNWKKLCMFAHTIERNRIDLNKSGDFQR